MRENESMCDEAVLDFPAATLRFRLEGQFHKKRQALTIKPADVLVLYVGKPAEKVVVDQVKAFDGSETYSTELWKAKGGAPVVPDSNVIGIELGLKEALVSGSCKEGVSELIEALAAGKKLQVTLCFGGDQHGTFFLKPELSLRMLADC